MGLSSTNSFDPTADGSNKSGQRQPDHHECIKILNLVLDEEATAEERECFEKHIENCMPYYEIYNVDKAIKEMIKQKCANQQTPTDLIESIKSKISQEAD